MLNDIFAKRYKDIRIWPIITDLECTQICVQMFRIVSEQICPYYIDGNESIEGKKFWAEVHSELSMELGLTVLSPKKYYNETWHSICERWMLDPLRSRISLLSNDEYLKERISLIELCVRKRKKNLDADSEDLPVKVSAIRARGGSNSEFLTRHLSNFHQNELLSFESAVAELNTRLVKSGIGLHYHNGFFQLSNDEMVSSQVEEPFWRLLADSKWRNADIDFKEAVDRKDKADRDPAFYAMRSLESVIKIISDSKGLTTGKEKGAHNFVDNLASKSADYWLKAWEAEQIKALFTHVRNPLGHGPGSQQMSCCRFRGRLLKKLPLSFQIQ